MLAPVGLFLLMAAWDWLATVAVIYTADRNLAAVPFAMALAVCSFVGITALRRTWACGAAWILGAGAGTLLGLYFP